MFLESFVLCQNFTPPEGFVPTILNMVFYYYLLFNFFYTLFIIIIIKKSYLPKLEFLLLFGLTIVTKGKKSLSWEYIKVISFPLKILATKFPPGFNIWVVILSAYWKY